MKVSDSLRNQYTTLDVKRGKAVSAVCSRCGTGLPRPKKYCLPCAATVYEEKLEARRPRKRRLHRYGEKA